MKLVVISGGQTGADQGGLAAALAVGLPTGGWAPRGWRTADGPNPFLPSVYRMREHASAQYPDRTFDNVGHSDATLIVGRDTSPGSRLTRRYSMIHGKPYLYAPWTRADGPLQTGHILPWLVQHNVQILNVAGNREETNPGIFAATVLGLVPIFRAYQPTPRVLNKKHPMSPFSLLDYVYVGRPGPWGNTFAAHSEVPGVTQVADNGEALAAHADWIRHPDQAAFRDHARIQLRGKNLVCWCSPAPCHADTLLQIANSPPET